MRPLNRHTKKKLRRGAVFLVALSIVIGGLTWFDAPGLHHGHADPHAKRHFTRAIFAETPDQLRHMPKNVEALVLADTFTNAHGFLHITPGLAPQELPSRDLDLLFRLQDDNLPTRQVIDAIGKTVLKWQEAGANVTYAVVGIDNPLASAEKIQTLTKYLRMASRRNYQIGLLVPAAFADHQKNALVLLGNMSKYIGTFFFDVRNAPLPEMIDTILKLNKFEVSFFIVSSKPPTMDDLETGLAGRTEVFIGLVAP